MFIDMMLLQNLVILRFHFLAYMIELMIHSEYKKKLKDLFIFSINSKLNYGVKLGFPLDCHI